MEPKTENLNPKYPNKPANPEKTCLSIFFLLKPLSFTFFQVFRTIAPKDSFRSRLKGGCTCEGKVEVKIMNIEYISRKCRAGSKLSRTYTGNLDIVESGDIVSAMELSSLSCGSSPVKSSNPLLSNNLPPIIEPGRAYLLFDEFGRQKNSSPEDRTLAYTESAGGMSCTSGMPCASGAAGAAYSYAGVGGIPPFTVPSASLSFLGDYTLKPAWHQTQRQVAYVSALDIVSSDRRIQSLKGLPAGTAGVDMSSYNSSGCGLDGGLQLLADLALRKCTDGTRHKNPPLSKIPDATSKKDVVVPRSSSSSVTRSSSCEEVSSEDENEDEDEVCVLTLCDDGLVEDEEYESERKRAQLLRKERKERERREREEVIKSARAIEQEQARERERGRESESENNAYVHLLMGELIASLPPAGKLKLLAHFRAYNMTSDMATFSKSVQELVDEYDMSASRERGIEKERALARARERERAILPHRGAAAAVPATVQQEQAALARATAEAERTIMSEIRNPRERKKVEKRPREETSRRQEGTLHLQYQYWY